MFPVQTLKPMSKKAERGGEPNKGKEREKQNLDQITVPSAMTYLSRGWAEAAKLQQNDERTEEKIGFENL